MSGFASATSGNPTTHAATNDAENPCDKSDKMAPHEPGSLATIPAEIVLSILGSLKKKKDWLSLARTCRRVSSFVVAELDKYNVEHGQNYALWYACVTNKPTILLHQIHQDAAVVNRHFLKDFERRRVKRVVVPSNWRLDPDCTRFGGGQSPLSVAIIAGSGTIIQLLLANGADPNRRDTAPVFLHVIPWYPIDWAVASKHESSVATIEMLAAHSANMNQVSEHFIQDASDKPIRTKQAPIFHLLRLQKPIWNSQDNRQTSCEVFNDDLRQLQGLRLRQLKALLQCGADPNITYECDRVTPVFSLLSNLAIYSPSFYFDKSVMLSHEEDAQADVVNEIVTSFLDMLRDFGANIRRLGNTYFTYGYEKIDYRIFSLLPETPLHAACKLHDRHKPIIDWFLCNGLPIDSPSRNQGTPLMAYCGSTFVDVDQFKKFLGNGPAINHSDVHGRTALHYLCANQGLRPQVREKAVKIMLDRDADPTFVNNEGNDPAKELDPRQLGSAYKDVLAMLETAKKSWNKRARKREERGSNNRECLDLTSSKNRNGRTDNRRSGREREWVSHGNNKPEGQESGYGDRKTGHGAGSFVSSRGRNRGAAQGSNRGNRRQNQDINKDRNNGSTRNTNGNNGNTQGGDRRDTPRTHHDKGARRGNRDTYKYSDNCSPQNTNGNNSNTQGEDKENPSRKHDDKGTPPAESDQSAPRRIHLRGGIYYSDCD
ncbi:hypothetical protein F4803DRAFT_525954 [Xylaria telfairii]|nr:hypothetical protein F4803DRAFT_525954 [Xylaria telfairii]